MQVLIEPINRYETNFVNTGLQGLELMDEVGEPNLRLLLDTFHMNIEQVNLTTALREAGDKLGYIHFADSNRLAPGQGHIDFVEVVHTLISIGYSGFLTVEILPLPDDASAMHQAGNFFKSMKRLSEVSEYRRDLVNT